MFPRPSNNTCTSRKRFSDALRAYERHQQGHRTRTLKKTTATTSSQNQDTLRSQDTSVAIYHDETVYTPTFTDMFGGSWTTSLPLDVLGVLGTYSSTVENDVRYRFLPVMTQHMLQFLQRGSLVETDTIPQTQYSMDSSLLSSSSSLSGIRTPTDSISTDETDSFIFDQRKISVAKGFNNPSSARYTHTNNTRESLIDIHCDKSNYSFDGDLSREMSGFDQCVDEIHVTTNVNSLFSSTNSIGQPNHLLSSILKSPIQYIGADCSHLALTEIANTNAMPLFFDLDTHWIDMCGKIEDEDLAVLATICSIVQATVRNFFTCHNSDRIDWKTAGEMACTRTDPRPIISGNVSSDRNVALDTIDFCMKRQIQRLVDISNYEPQSIAQCRKEAQSHSADQSNVACAETASSRSSTTAASTSSAGSLFSMRRRLLGDFADNLESWSEHPSENIIPQSSPIHSGCPGAKKSDGDEVYSMFPITLESRFVNRCWAKLRPRERVIYKIGLHIHFPNLIVSSSQSLQIRKGVVTNLIKHIALNHRLSKHTRMLMYSLVPDAHVGTKKDSNKIAGELIAFWNSIVDSSPIARAQCRKVFSKKSSTCLHCFRKNKVVSNNNVSNVGGNRHFNGKKLKHVPSEHCEICGGTTQCDEGSDAVNTPFIHVDGNSHTISEDDLLDAMPKLASSHIGRLVARYPMDCSLMQPEEIEGRNRTESPNNVATQTVVKRVPNVMMRFMPTDMPAQRLKQYVTKWVRITTVHIRDKNFLDVVKNHHLQFHQPLQYCWCKVLSDGKTHVHDQNDTHDHLQDDSCIPHLHQMWDSATPIRRTPSNKSRSRSIIEEGMTDNGQSVSMDVNMVVTPKQRRVLIHDTSIDAIMRTLSQYEYGKNSVYSVEVINGNILSSGALIASSVFRKMITTNVISSPQIHQSPKIIARLWPNAYRIINSRQMVLINQWFSAKRCKSMYRVIQTSFDANNRSPDNSQLSSRINGYSGPYVKIIFQNSLAFGGHASAEFRENRRCAIRLHHRIQNDDVAEVAQMTVQEKISGLATHNSSIPYFILFPFGMFQVCPSVHVCKNKMVHVADVSSDISQLLFGKLMQQQ